MTLRKLIYLAVMFAKIGLALGEPANIHLQKFTTTSSFTAKNVECILYEEDDDNDQDDDEYWICGDLEKNDDYRFSALSVATINSAKLDLQAYIESSGATSGNSKLYLSDVTANYLTASLLIPDDATIRVETFQDSQRRLAPKTGNLKSLFVRVIDNSNLEPAISRDKVWEINFEHPDALSTSQQFKACSAGKLDIKPYGDNIDTAVVDVGVDLTVVFNETVRGTVANLALEKVRAFEFFDELDFVQLCLPAGTIRQGKGLNWFGYAPVGGYWTVGNDELCHSVSMWIHELGHNMELGHSNPLDFTDPMGPSHNEQNGGYKQQCFNAAKNFQLGWYPNMQKTIDPINFSGPSYSETYTIFGVDDYSEDKTTDDGLVVLNFGQYYVGYNSKKGINNGVLEHADKVIIYKVDEMKKGADSDFQGAIGYQDSYTIQDYVTGRNVTIKMIEKNIDLGTAIVTIFDDENAPEDDSDDENDITPGPCSSERYEFTIEILGDNYPQDISWTLLDINSGKVALENGGYTAKPGDEPDIRIFCLPYGRDYKFTIVDSFGDGICCRNFGQGYYKATGQSDEFLFHGGALNPPGYATSESQYFSTDLPPGSPTASPTGSPTKAPTILPTVLPTATPTASPTASPTATPTSAPTATPTDSPTRLPTAPPTVSPTLAPTDYPIASPTSPPTSSPTAAPTFSPTAYPTGEPTVSPTVFPTVFPTASPTRVPTHSPTVSPTASPTVAPTDSPIASPTTPPTSTPTEDLGDCADDPSFYFKKEFKTCEWIGQKWKTVDSLRKFCNKKPPIDKSKRVFDFCPTTCYSSDCTTCSDRPQSFNLDGSSTDCGTIVAESDCDKNSDKGKKVGKGPLVSELCPVTCEICS